MSSTRVTESISKTGHHKSEKSRVFYLAKNDESHPDLMAGALLAV